MRVTIASRRSDLARIQAYQVGEALSASQPHIEINYSFHESLGDKNQNDPLWQMPEKGVFTQDFRAGLLRGDFDLVVHSWKDLAIEEDPETEIVATLTRADARDLLLVPKGRLSRVAQTGRMAILTSSPRRAHNLDTFLRAALPAKITELSFENVRGNVPTRVRKLISGETDGLIVAKAALDRLLSAPQTEFAAVQKELREALSHCRWMVLPLRENPAAPAQGALAVEISRRRGDMRELLSPLNCSDTFRAVISEREILRSYGGGCHQKIGCSVLQRPYGEITFLRGVTENGRLLDTIAFRPKFAVSKAAQSDLWPLSLADVDWFVREPIAVSLPDGSDALWIAKADAVPQQWNIGPDRLVWASGVQTWKRLARRGVWVNGCAESLGEQELPRIEALTGGPVGWLKVSHESGYTDEIPVLATYRLRPKADELGLGGKKYFFWQSGSSFEYALSKNPWLKEMTHFCGPGNTRKILERHGIEPHVFLDHAQWLKEMTSVPGAIATGS